jgi:fumarate hydratase class II
MEPVTMTTAHAHQATTRTESDSMGEMQVPGDALWGASTQRAVENFPIAHKGVPKAIIHAFGHLKAACAQVNKDLGKLDAKLADGIISAAEEVAQGKHDDQFPVDVYQTGSGTSTNMNANEVIANLANQSMGEAIGTKKPVHPNDHVNMGQSSNDTFPTAMNIGMALALANHLKPAVKRLHQDLAGKAEQWDRIVKIGRTHLMDATPIRMGQVFSGYATQAQYADYHIDAALTCLTKGLPIGGTAVGTGINTHPEFGQRVAKALSQRTGLDFEEATNHPEAQATKDLHVDAHGQLKTIAVSLSKIANDIRHLGSGPRCGIFELQLPAIQPGSSIMPGKVNPVICESVMQVACRVNANDQAITMGGFGGIGSLFELNVAMPMMADSFMESVNLLTNVVHVMVDKLLDGLQVNEKRCRDLIEQSLMMVTSLAPEIGYDKAAKIAKQAFEEDRTIRDLVREQNLLDDQRLDQVLDPESMTRPSA